MAIDLEDVDLETVNLLPTYRTGFLPPKGGSLTTGEIYVEVPVDGSAPRMWIGGLDGDIEPSIPGAPLNLTVPHLYQEGDILTCTMGNWSGKPTAYAYQWQGDGMPIGTDADTYPVTGGDVGTTVICIVTATNDLGTTEAPPSNSVLVASPVTEEKNDA